MTTPVRNESGYFNRNPYNEDIPYGETQPRPRAPQRRGPTPPSMRQLELIANLCIERDLTAEKVASDMGLELDALTGGRNGTASAMIATLFAIKKPQTVSRAIPEAGFYRLGEDIYRVRISRAGNWYADLCLLPQAGSGRTRLDWRYVGHRVRISDAEGPMPDDEVGRFLKFCMRCNAPLTNDDSLKLGYGPTCAKKVAL